MTRKQPNILFILTDEQRADHLGCYGNSILQTPNIDSIANQGVAYDRFYTAVPVCMPNRASIATGRLPSAHGVRQNGIPLSLESTTFVDILTAGGYSTAAIGKLHLQNIGNAPIYERSKPGKKGQLSPPELLREAYKLDRQTDLYKAENIEAWRNDPQRKIKTPYYGFDHVRICSGDGDMVEGHYTSWANDRHADVSSLRGPENAFPAEDYSVPQAYRTRMPEELYPTKYIAEETISFLSDHAQNTDDQPFFIHCSFPNPHHPFSPPGKYWDMYNPDDIELPPSFDWKMPDNLPPVPGIKEGFERGRKEPNAYWPIEVTERQAREAIALTYGMISMIDDAVGEILASLNSFGLSENTIIIFASDHGDYMGDQGMLLKLGLHRHSTIRMPFIWCDLNLARTSERDGRLASTIDIAPTILDAAGLRPYHGIQGFSLLDKVKIREGVVIEDYGVGVFRDPDAVAGMLTYVTDQWRMTIFEGTNWGELYNLVDDPDEVKNLWNNKNSQAIKNELNSGLIHELINLRDRSASPTGQG